MKRPRLDMRVSAFGNLRRLLAVLCSVSPKHALKMFSDNKFKVKLLLSSIFLAMLVDSNWIPEVALMERSYLPSKIKDGCLESFANKEEDLDELTRSHKEVIGIYTNNFDLSLNTKNDFPIFATVIEENYVTKKQDLFSAYKLTQEDTEDIEKLSKDP
ncbi:DNA replication licensing factor MCM2 [Tanacetum coccineum]